jgi:hypothetical protein
VHVLQTVLFIGKYTLPSTSGEMLVVGSVCSPSYIFTVQSCYDFSNKVCQTEYVLACFLVYSMMLSYLHRLCNGDWNNDCEWWIVKDVEEAVITSLRYNHRVFLKGVGKPKNNLSQDIWSLDRELNLGAPKYKIVYSRAPIIQGPIIHGVDYTWSQIVSNI